MKGKLFVGLVSLSVGFALILSGCGGGDSGNDGGGGSVGADTMQSLLALNRSYEQGNFTDLAYFTKMADLFAQVDARSGGPEELSAYLTTKVFGYSPTGARMVGIQRFTGAGTKTSTGDDAGQLQQVLSTIQTSATYRVFENAWEGTLIFLGTVIQGLAHDTTIALQVCDPELAFVALTVPPLVRGMNYNIAHSAEMFGTPAGADLMNRATTDPFGVMAEIDQRTREVVGDREVVIVQAESGSESEELVGNGHYVVYVGTINATLTTAMQGQANTIPFMDDLEMGLVVGPDGRILEDGFGGPVTLTQSGADFSILFMNSVCPWTLIGTINGDTISGIVTGGGQTGEVHQTIDGTFVWVKVHEFIDRPSESDLAELFDTNGE